MFWVLGPVGRRAEVYGLESDVGIKFTPRFQVSDNHILTPKSCT